MIKATRIWLPLLALAGTGVWWWVRGDEAGWSAGVLRERSGSGLASGRNAPLGKRAEEPARKASDSRRPEGVFRDLPGEEKGEALKLVFPEPELPGIINAPAIAESLSLLAKNGSDLSKPMASRHRVMAATPEVAAQIGAWAKENGFTAQEPELALGHGGVKRYAVELVRRSVPEAAALEREGREVFAGAGQIPGAWYQTWQGEIVR